MDENKESAIPSSSMDNESSEETIEIVVLQPASKQNAEKSEKDAAISNKDSEEINPSKEMIRQKTEDQVFLHATTSKSEFGSPASFTPLINKEFQHNNEIYIDHSISMNTLLRLANQEVLKKLKTKVVAAKLAKLEKGPALSEPCESIRKSKWKLPLYNTKTFKRKSCRTICHELKHHRSRSRTIHDFYLERVANGTVSDVRAIFKYCLQERSFNLNKNCVDQNEKNALRLAIENKDPDMCELLLRNEVSIKDNLYHAVQRNFIECVKMILKRSPSKDSCIQSDNNYFNVGTTPMVLASCNNNYEILKLLHSYGHELKNVEEGWKRTDSNLESAVERMMIFKAKSSPAYISLICEEEHKNPFDFCMELIENIREHANLEREHNDFYNELENQIEDYMCCLLDQLQSSEELAKLFQYRLLSHSELPTTQRSQRCFAFELFHQNVSAQTDFSSSLSLLDTASKHQLVKFVTHPNSQSALDYVRYRYLPFLKEPTFKTTLLTVVIGLLFPVWSILYLVAPKTGLGGMLTLPFVSFQCYLMSNMVFIALLVANLITKTEETDYLGAPPSVLEWIITLWVVGKLGNEIQECLRRGCKKYFRDHWNLIDISQLFLFTIAIGLRIYDIYQHKDEKPISRHKYPPFEPRQISYGVMSCAYLLVLLLVLGFTRTSRRLGPLQISLTKMLFNVAQFLCIFPVVMFAFALSLTELYWYYGTAQGSEWLCKERNQTECEPALFTGIGYSLDALFWALFGLIDLKQLTLGETRPFTETVGRVLLGVYFVVAVIILLNMLIAMMAKSFEATSENEETEWKFHRTVLWIRFSRLEFTRPSPMNLIPNPRWFYKLLTKSQDCFANVCERWDSNISNESVRLQRSDAMPSRTYHSHAGLPQEKDIAIAMSNTTTSAFQWQHGSMKMMTKLVQRYKFTKLLQAKSEVNDGFNRKCPNCRMNALG